MSPAVTIERLSKKYLIRPRRAERYTALRDVLAERGQAVGRALLRRLKGQEGPATSREQEVFWALRDVSLEVGQGQVVGIIGRNGAGKSTLLKILARITEPSEGRATIRGRVASLLEVGTGFHPELTGRENILLNGSILGMTRLEVRRRFDDIVAFAGIERFLDTPIKRYSSGMYVRLAFAISAHLDSDVLLIDEVLAVGDADFQRKCLGRISAMTAQQGRTVLFVSHNMQTVAQLCSRAVLLERGAVAFDGPAQETTRKYFQQLSQPAPSPTHSDRQRAIAHGGGVSLQQVRYLDGAGAAQPRLDRSEVLRIVLCFEIAGRVPEMDIAMAVIHADGTRVFSEVLSESRGRVPLDPGTYSVEFELEARYLKPETYFMTLFFLDAASVLLQVDGLPFPEIVDADGDPYRESRRWGLVRLPVVWRAIERTQAKAVSSEPAWE
jgi:lipopolysaccharide transport system ATP-binding protein